MLKPESRPITIESRVDETITRYPSTGPIFLREGPLHAARPGQLHPAYAGMTLGEYAALGSLVVERLLESLNAAAEAEQFAHQTASRSRSSADESGWHARTTPPVGAIGYTGSYHEPSADIAEVSVVSVLEARGPV
jgi:hypothetical protein